MINGGSKNVNRKKRPLPCGIGKKYKKCCLNGETSCRQGIEKSDIEQAVKTTLISAYDFIVKNQFQGGCHLISALLFILLSEQGYEPIVAVIKILIQQMPIMRRWWNDKAVTNIRKMKNKVTGKAEKMNEKIYRYRNSSDLKEN